MKISAKFSVASLFLIVLFGAVFLGMPMRRQHVLQQEEKLATRLELFRHRARSRKDYDEFREELDDDACLDLFERHIGRESEVSHRIAAALLYHLVVLRDHPEGTTLAHEHLDSDITVVRKNAADALVWHYRIARDIHYSQYFTEAMANGFDVESPEDVYLLTTEVYSNFIHSDGWQLMLDYWPHPKAPWIGTPSRVDADGNRIPTHSFDDTIDALAKINVQVSNDYEEIVAILRKCNGEPSDSQYGQLEQLGNQILREYKEEDLLRYAIRHREFFAGHFKEHQKKNGYRDHRDSGPFQLP